MDSAAVAAPLAPNHFSGTCLPGGHYTSEWSKAIRHRVTKNPNGSTGYATVIASSRAEVVVGANIRVHTCAHSPCHAHYSDSKYGLVGPPIHVQLCAAPAAGPAVAGPDVELEAAEPPAEPAPPPAHAAAVPSEIEAVPNSPQPPMDIVADALASDAATPVPPEPPSSVAAVPPELETVPPLPESLLCVLAGVDCAADLVDAASDDDMPDLASESESECSGTPRPEDVECEPDDAYEFLLLGAPPAGAPLQPVAAAPAAPPVSGDLAVVKCDGALSASQAAERRIIDSLLALARELRRPRSFVGQSFFMLLGILKKCRPFLWVGEHRCDLIETYVPWALALCSNDCVVDAAACVLVAQDAGRAEMKPVSAENPVSECRHFVSLVAVADEGLETAGASFQAFYNRLGCVALGTVVDGDCGIDVACQMLGLEQTLEQRCALRED